MADQQEIWIDYIHEGKTTYYSVSSLGRIASTGKRKLRLMKFSRNRDGYLFCDFRINLERKIVYVHQIVAELFIPNPGNLPEINHENGNKENNAVSNLTRCTKRENMSHAVEMGLMSHKSGKEHHNCRRVGKFFSGILIRPYNFIRETKKDGFSPSLVSRSIKNNSTHMGFNWKYLD